MGWRSETRLALVAGSFVLGAIGLLLLGWLAWGWLFEESHRFPLDVSDLVVAGSDATSPWPDAQALIAELEPRLPPDFRPNRLSWRLYHPARIDVDGTYWAKWRVEAILDDVREERARAGP